MIDIMKNQGWTAIPGNGSVFFHGTIRAIMVVYVDDMLLLAKPRDAGPLLRSPEKAVMFKDFELPLTRYLGARYNFTEFDIKRPNAPRTLRTDMDEYATNGIAKFNKEYHDALH